MPLKTYGIIVKTDAVKFVKYRKVTNLRKFYIFLDKTFPSWRWGNVYVKKKSVGSFTNKHRPVDF